MAAKRSPTHTVLVRVAAVLLLAALSLGAIVFAGALLSPHDPEANPEAFLIAEYERSGTDHDVVFLGDCEVYEAFSPVTLWQAYGINAHVIGSPQQLLWQSSGLLEEVFSRESPSVVVLGVYALAYDEPQSEPYNRMTLDSMRWSSAKVRAIRASMTKGESFLSYVLPLLRYHNRWAELSWNDFTSLFEEPAAVSYHGYLMQTSVVPAEGVPGHASALPLTAEGFGDRALDAFDRIVRLCREHGATLILVKAPTDSWCYPWYEEYDAWTCDLAAFYDIPYYNFLTPGDSANPQIDFLTDTYDGGIHLNVSGAEKLSAVFGKILSEDYLVPDRRTEAELSRLWAEEINRYEAQKKEASPE